MVGTVAIRSPPESPNSIPAKEPSASAMETGSEAEGANAEGANAGAVESDVAPGGYLDQYVDARTLLILPQATGIAESYKNEYTILFHDATKAQADYKKLRKIGAEKEQYESSFDKVVPHFRDIHTFWAAWDRMDRISIKSGQVSVFRKGIKPSWEDSGNKGGGRWCITHTTNKKHIMDGYFTDLVLGMLGNSLLAIGDEDLPVKRDKDNNIIADPYDAELSAGYKAMGDISGVPGALNEATPVEPVSGEPKNRDMICGVNLVVRPKFIRIEVWNKFADAYRVTGNAKAQLAASKDPSSNVPTLKLREMDARIRNVMGANSSDVQIAYKSHENDLDYNKIQIEKKQLHHANSATSATSTDADAGGWKKAGSKDNWNEQGGVGKRSFI